jgi:putative SOS response-associated peptidase YedK
LPGRLFLTATVAEVAGHFGADAGGLAGTGAWRDAAPGDQVAALVSDGGRRLAPMRWGLIPMGRANARGRPVPETIANARSETLFSKSAFAGLARCVLPVSGWHEWTGSPRRKARWAITAADGGLLAFAAVYDVWRAPGGAAVASLATVTCAPNADVAPVHDRMPAILEAAELGVWLGEAAGESAAVLRPWPEGRLRVTAAP